MAKRISMGTWAYVLGPYADRPVLLDEIIERLAGLGFDGLELDAFGPHVGPEVLDNPAKRDELRYLWESKGLGCSGFMADLSGQRLLTTTRRDSYLAAFEKNIRLCEDLGIGVIRVDTIEPPSILGELVDGEPAEVVVDYDDALKRVVGTWKESAKIAADHGLRIVWEFEPQYAFNKPSDVFRILDGVNEDNFTTLFDVANANTMAVHGARQVGKQETLHGGIVELAQRLTGKVGRVHLADTDATLHNGRSWHLPFGQGELDFDEIIPALGQSGCPDDWWTIDLGHWPEAWKATEVCKRFVDKLVERYEQPIR